MVVSVNNDHLYYTDGSKLDGRVGLAVVQIMGGEIVEM